MGGIGNLKGAVLGGLMIGVIQQISDNRIGWSGRPRSSSRILVLIMVFQPAGPARRGDAGGRMSASPRRLREAPPRPVASGLLAAWAWARIVAIAARDRCCRSSSTRGSAVHRRLLDASSRRSPTCSWRSGSTSSSASPACSTSATSRSSRSAPSSMGWLGSQLLRRRRRRRHPLPASTRRRPSAPGHPHQLPARDLSSPRSFTARRGRDARRCRRCACAATTSRS